MDINYFELLFNTKSKPCYFGTVHGFLKKIFQRQFVVQPALSGTVNTCSAKSKFKKTYTHALFIVFYFFFYDYSKGIKGICTKNYSKSIIYNWHKKILCYTMYMFSSLQWYFIRIDYHYWLSHFHSALGLFERGGNSNSRNSNNFTVSTNKEYFFFIIWTKNNFLLDKFIKFTIYLHPYVEFVIDFVLRVAPIMCIVICHFGFQTTGPSH